MRKNQECDIKSQKVTKQEQDKAVKKALKGTKTGETIRERFKGKKDLNKLATRYFDEIMSEKQLERFGSCGDWLRFAVDNGFEHAKVMQGSFCEHRFCPMCNMRKSFRDSKRIEHLLRLLQEEEKQEFIFVTFTIQNCSGEELRERLDDMNKAISKLFRRKRLKESTNGYIRKIEVTTDQTKVITEHWYKRRQGYCERKGLQVGDMNPNFNTYHPHSHMVVAVDKSYFANKSDTYITQAEWLELWADVMGEEPEKVGVDVRKVQDRATSNAIVEIAKYSAKDSDLYKSQSIFLTFFMSLRGRQLLTYNGLFKEYLKSMKEGKLDHLIEKWHDERREAQLLNNEKPILYDKVIDGLWKLMVTKKNRKFYDYMLKMRDLTEQEYYEVNNEKDIELAKQIDEKTKG